MLLSIHHLTVELTTDEGSVWPVSDVSFDIPSGKTVALVGESGSGKTITAYAIAGLLPDIGRITDGTIHLKDIELSALDAASRREILGRRIALIFQNPLTALHPAKTVGAQMIEMCVVRAGMHKSEALTLAVHKLELVGLPEPRARLGQYPHELSGGQRQRVMIAMMLMGDPELLIADEPTTALDVTIQAQILELLKDLQARLGLSILLITHDMGVVADMAHAVCVMKDGRLVEQGSVQQIFAQPREGYTQTLLAAVPVLGSSRTRIDPPAELGTPLVQIRDLSVAFPLGGGLFRRAPESIRAVDGVTLAIARGETLALVGESGCGKSTLGRALVGLTPATDGSVLFDGVDIHRAPRRALARLRPRAQIIFQDPASSLNPRLRVADIVGEPLKIHGMRSKSEREARVLAMLTRVGLQADHLRRFPHEFSGGQQQRISVARALILNPDFVVCDEPTSALDVSVQAEVLTLLHELQKERGLTLLFISHGLAVVEQIADRVAVMYLGRIVEIGATSRVINDPRHPYTQALMSAVPVPDPITQAARGRLVLLGSPPKAAAPPPGCPFHPRCRHALLGQCDVHVPTLTPFASREVSCDIVSG